MTDATVRVLAALNLDISWDIQRAGIEALKEDGDPMPGALIDSIQRTEATLKGPVTTPIGKGFQSINVQLRKRLDLFANIRPVFSLAGVPSRYKDVDLVVVRENTEGLYSGLEHEVIPGVMESLKIITETASKRISRFAFDYARKNCRSRITVVHKANIMKLSDGLFLRCFREVAQDYSDIEADERIVDNMCMQLVVRPEDYDVLVMPNLYGDIVSDLCAGLVGGLGMVPGANLGECVAVFEAVHGSAPDIAGRNLANPTALMRSAVLMLAHLGESDAAARLTKALNQVLSGKQILTADLGGTASTTQFTDAVVVEIEGTTGG